jgi:hypothetical protein
LSFSRFQNLNRKLPSRTAKSRIRNQVQWGRLYLVRAGYLDSSRRGIWSLTEKGAETDLGAFDFLQQTIPERKLELIIPNLEVLPERDSQRLYKVGFVFENMTDEEQHR